MLIYQEALPAGSRLPSVRQLAMELSINPNTIQRAYAELEQEGLIYPVKGRGNFVAYDESLLRYRKDEIYRKLEEIVREAGEIGISRQELSDYLGERQEKVLHVTSGEDFCYD